MELAVAETGESKDAPQKPTTDGATNEYLCFICGAAESSKRAVYRLICGQCSEDEDGRLFCMSCLRGLCDTRAHHPWNLHPEDYIYVNPGDGMCCPFDKTMIQHYTDRRQYDIRHEEKLPLPLPYGWLGDRPEYTKCSFNQHKPVVDALVMPYYDKVRALQNEIAFLRSTIDGLNTVRQTLASSGAGNVAAEYAQKIKRHEQTIKTYSGFICQNKTAAENYPWLSSKAPPIPESDYTLARNINSKAVPPISTYGLLQNSDSIPQRQQQAPTIYVESDDELDGNNEADSDYVDESEQMDSNAAAGESEVVGVNRDNQADSDNIDMSQHGNGNTSEMAISIDND